MLCGCCVATLILTGFKSEKMFWFGEVLWAKE